jgi:bifunctional DNase/RNase
MPDRTRRRLARLIVDLLRTLGASIIDIELHQGEQGVLRAALRIASPRGVHSFDIPGSDGLLLATETGVVPVMATEEILAIERRSHEQASRNETGFLLPPDVQELLTRLEQFGSLDDHSDVSE